MTVTINGTTGVSGVAGSATTPALIGSDADSGYYINSANEPNASVNGTAVWSAASSFGFKNRIINGGMVIDQRNAGASITATNGFCLDRWTTRSSQASKYSVQQVTASPTGFSNSLLVTSLSAYSVGAADYFTIDQRIETANAIDFAWGTSAGSPATLSFWVRSSLTGTFTGAIGEYNSASATYGFSYTISAANTWEYKTITIPCPTIGTWNTTLNGGYITVTFGLGVGANESTASNGSWLAVGRRAGTGGTSVVGTNGATWQVTGVQLEKGSTATSFDFRSYGTELALCQRYYFRLNGFTANYGFATLAAYTSGAVWGYLTGLPVTMRSSPTVSASSASHFTPFVPNAGSGTALGSFTSLTSTTTSISVNGSSGSAGLTAGNASVLCANTTSAWIDATSEL